MPTYDFINLEISSLLTWFLSTWRKNSNSVCLYSNFSIKTSSSFIADRYAVGPVLEFLKNTEVGSRDGGAVGENEWEQRRDQEGEDQLGG